VARRAAREKVTRMVCEEVVVRGKKERERGREEGEGGNWLWLSHPWSPLRLPPSVHLPTALPPLLHSLSQPLPPLRCPHNTDLFRPCPPSSSHHTPASSSPPHRLFAVRTRTCTHRATTFRHLARSLSILLPSHRSLPFFARPVSSRRSIYLSPTRSTARSTPRLRFC
jgi:hypothetical protein